MLDVWLCTLHCTLGSGHSGAGHNFPSLSQSQREASWHPGPCAVQYCAVKWCTILYSALLHCTVRLSSLPWHRLTSPFTPGRGEDRKRYQGGRGAAGAGAGDTRPAPAPRFSLSLSSLVKAAAAVSDSFTRLQDWQMGNWSNLQNYKD